MTKIKSEISAMIEQRYGVLGRYSRTLDEVMREINFTNKASCSGPEKMALAIKEVDEVNFHITIPSTELVRPGHRAITEMGRQVLLRLSPTDVDIKEWTDPSQTVFNIN